MNIWSVLGLSVTFVAVFCVLMLEVFQDKNYYETYKWYFCGLLIGMGSVLWILGKFVWGKKKEEGAHPQTTLAQPPVRNQGESGDADSQAPAQPRLPLEPVIADDSEEAKDTGPFFLFTPGYWGAMLVTFGVIVVFIVPNYSAKKVTARTTTNIVEKPKIVPPPATNSAPKPPAPVEPPKFPDVKVQGIIYRPGNSSVVINGKACFVGDYVEDAEIVAIDLQSITVEIRGFKKTYLLER